VDHPVNPGLRIRDEAALRPSLSNRKRGADLEEIDKQQDDDDKCDNATTNVHLNLLSVCPPRITRSIETQSFSALSVSRAMTSSL
jgi:hypothetical protein